MKTEVSFESGWKTDLQITDANGKVLDSLIRLHPISGRQFAFVKTLSPGQYTVSGFRRVGAGETAFGPSRPMQSFIGRGLPFTIVEGEVTVFPIIFHVFHESVGPNRSSSHLKMVHLEGKELEEFKVVMTKANKNNEWKVNWPE